MGEACIMSISSGYFNPAYEKFNSSAGAIKGYPTCNIFCGECELFENLVYSQTEERIEAVIHARSAQQPVCQCHSGFKAEHCGRH